MQQRRYSMDEFQVPMQLSRISRVEQGVRTTVTVIAVLPHLRISLSLTTPTPPSICAPQHRPPSTLPRIILTGLGGNPFLR